MLIDKEELKQAFEKRYREKKLRFNPIFTLGEIIELIESAPTLIGADAGIYENAIGDAIEALIELIENRKDA